MGWWFGRKSAPADARPFVPAWLTTISEEEGFARFLTFEVVADDEPPTISSILADASGGAVRSDADQQLIGFAAYGRSIKSAIEPLVDSFGVELFDDGEALRAPSSNLPVIIAAAEFGNGADQAKSPRLKREQLPARSVPAALRLAYYDPSRDYQTGEARAAAGEQGGNEAQQDLPAVLSAADAKSLAQQMLARAWRNRDKLTLRLPRKRLGLEPGSKVELPISPSQWIAEKVSVDGFVVVTELRPSIRKAAAIAADAGRIVPNSDIAAGPLSLALLDVPNVLGLSSTGPAVLLAASSASAGWKSRPVEVTFGGQSITTQTARSKGLLGRAVSALTAGGTDLIDRQNSVDVALVDTEQWLTSCDDDGLAAGENIAVLGRELIQFGQAAPLGGGRFRLSHLLRGRGGTEWACIGHATDDVFCLIQAGALQPILLPNWTLGGVISATALDTLSASTEFLGEGLRPPSPVDLSAERQPNGDLLLSWIRRSRQGFAWIDEVDAPLGETREQYRVVLTGSLSWAEWLADQPTVTVAQTDLTALGIGPATIEVRQIGDFAASRPAELNFILS